MFLEKGTANVFIEGVGKKGIDVFETDSVFWGYRRVLNAILEELDVPLKGVLIHGVDVGEVKDAEKKKGSAECDWSEA